MGERPILFSGPIVRAILDGTKTQTRRVMKPQPVGRAGVVWPADDRWGWSSAAARTMVDEREAPCCCPYGYKRERLWVRETWQYAGWTEDGQPWVRFAADGAKRLCERVPSDWHDRLTDTWAELSSDQNLAIDGLAADRRWRPAIHMPRWACRIELEVTGLRVERLQAMTTADAYAEGLVRGDPERHGPNMARWPVDDKAQDEAPGGTWANAVDVFAGLWDSINEARAPWASNPWVWVVEFRVVPRG